MPKLKYTKRDAIGTSLLMELELRERIKEKQIEADFNEGLQSSCKGCSFLEIVDKNERKVRCPYLVTNECLISSINKRGVKSAKKI